MRWTAADETSDEATRAMVFQSLHWRLDAKLEGYLARRLPPDDEPDVRQETWQSFYLVWMEDPGHPNPEALLFMIAARRVTDHWRAAGRNPVAPVDAAGLEALASMLVGEAPQTRVEHRQDLKRALGHLTEQQHQALMLRHIDGLSQEAVAALMGLGIDNTKRILKRARQELRDGMPGYYAKPRRTQA